MSKAILTLTIFVLSFIINPSSLVYAISPTATPTAQLKTPTPTSSKKINELKERIASRVAELNLVEKRGILGTIASISGTKITLNDTQNRARIIDTDEITEFIGSVHLNQSK